MMVTKSQELCIDDLVLGVENAGHGKASSERFEEQIGGMVFGFLDPR